MDEEKIINLYVNEKYTLRHISEIFNTNHHMIKRILVRNNIEIYNRNTLKKFTDEHKKKISISRKKLFDDGKITPWLKGKKASKEHVLRNMIGHIKYDISYEWVSTFDDIDKLKYLNRCITKQRDSINFDTELYIKYIEKFYYDEKFNYLYNEWVTTGDNWIKPSLDHINPKSLGGCLDSINNLSFISWFENRSKSNITYEKWVLMKNNIKYYL